MFSSLTFRPSEVILPSPGSPCRNVQQLFLILMVIPIILTAVLGELPVI